MCIGARIQQPAVIIKSISSLEIVFSRANQIEFSQQRGCRQSLQSASIFSSVMFYISIFQKWEKMQNRKCAELLTTTIVIILHASRTIWFFPDSWHVTRNKLRVSRGTERDQLCEDQQLWWPGHPASLLCPLSTRTLNEGYPKICNHGEGPYQGLLLVESTYLRFHI